jgi:hypothetical protein
MSSTLRNRNVPQPWLITILGAAASIPAGVIINQFPNSEATVGGAVMIIGATIGGAIVATRAVNPGSRAPHGALRRRHRSSRVDPIGGGDGSLASIQVYFLRFSGGAVVCIASAFGWVFGHIAG